ncbi:type IV secretion system protein [Sporolituus thermophilus]|uniref:Type IV secretion system protein TrbL n=1 Tax=Sporolituus thermophilus DSM 23256 TaxID=1123285 RepID=A0A1G7MJ37_9FIRM|nr:type IV secretion system protein [Sporolituus thermophilus]SDF61159.1 type IV secretion system protein TrbL [Sporolituus thermophilus DSM 23256]
MGMSEMMQYFANIFATATGAIQPVAVGIFATLVTISIALNHMLKGDDTDHIRLLVAEVIRFGFFFFIIYNYQYLVNTWIQGCFQFAEKIAPGGATQGIDPSAIMKKGYELVQPILGKISIMDVALANIVKLLMTVASALLVLAAYFLVAVQVFLTYTEFYLISAVAFALIGFAGHSRTAFLAEKAIGAVVSLGLKMLVLAAIVGISQPLLLNATLPAAANEGDMLHVFFTALTVALLAWQAPGLAMSLLAGAPSLTTQGAIGSAVSAISTTIAAGRMARTAGTGAAQAVKNAAQAFRRN